MAALIFSPLASWVLLGIVLAIAIAVYLAASAWLDRQEEELNRMSPEWVERERRRQDRVR